MLKYQDNNFLNLMKNRRGEFKMKNETEGKNNINIGIILIFAVLILLLIGNILILISNKKNDEKLDIITNNIMQNSDENTIN